MYATVITTSKQTGIGEGLTYKVGSGLGLGVGTLVKVPLRKRLTEGIVVDTSERKPEGGFEIREIAEVLSATSLLSESQITLAKWIAHYFLCTLRQALTPFLPGLPWSKLLPERSKKLSAISYQLSAVHLTPRQTAAYNIIKAVPCPTLLITEPQERRLEIYAALIKEALREGHSALLLLPDIFLAEEVAARLQELLKLTMPIPVFHSQRGIRERRDLWQRCWRGEVRFLIGTRSALFSPLRHLRLVLLEGEQDEAYKSEQTPRYHARTVAEELCHLLSAKLILGSSVPSLESWHRAKQGQYQLIELPRHRRRDLCPTVRIIDLAAQRCGKNYPLSPPLLEAIHQRFIRHEQVILLLNRRGYATSLLCLQCRKRIEDPTTGLPYTVYHRENPLSPHSQGAYLLSHQTGEFLPFPATCPHCSSHQLLEVGAGTQRLETLLRKLFPQTRILRADRDVLTAPKELQKLLQTMREEKADLLLGTQTVLRGLDLPQVTLIAVLLADVGLSLPHFRAGEQVFQLLALLTERTTTRKSREVIIQTFRPNALEIALAAKREIRQYLEGELTARERWQYPPTTPMVRLLFRGKDAERESREFLEQLNNRQVAILRITRSPIFSRHQKEWQVLLRGGNAQELLKKLPKIDCVVDVDPVECL